MLNALFDADGLMPHGTCLAWRPDLFWSLAVADGIISLCYFSIGGAIAVYAVKRTDMVHRGVMVAFAVVFALCGSTHFTDLWTLWSPAYGMQVVVKTVAAAVSLATAVVLWPLLPEALALPSTARLQAANRSLEREIDERRRVEASLRATTAQLHAANAELDSFAYAVSHDLRAPLRAMTGFSDALREDCGTALDAQAQGHLAEIALAGRHMGELIDGLLRLSRAARGELVRRQVDVSAAAAAILAELRRAEPGRRVGADIAPGLTAWGDARMLELALDNLLSNAWKYSAAAAEPHIAVTGADNTICVSDNGAGFDMAHADKLFKPFQRLHRQEEFPGLGIGLSTVNRIVQRHGGAIRAEGAVGRGATFCITLPGPAGPTGEGRSDEV